MNDAIPAGTRRLMHGRLRVHYDGYWIKAYDAPADSLQAKKQLIGALTRRLFNHCEHGINVPGARLEEARRAFDAERDPARKRVKGAMLAGCLFNRATDIFTKLVEIQALGVTIKADNALMRECGEHLQEALTLGKMVRHRSGEEGLDELWGEPFKAFAFPIEEFYKSRYVKIAQSMRAIDAVCDDLVGTFSTLPAFAGVGALLRSLADAAKTKCETLRTDPDILEAWTSFAVAAERLVEFQPVVRKPDATSERQASQGMQLIAAGRDLIYYVTRARVPMPKTEREFAERCEAFRRLYGVAGARNVA